MLRVQVLSHDPENDGYYGMTASGQILPLIRRVYDYADGLRISKKPLPVRGSWVMISFLGGDLRNPFHIGAFHPNLVDALPADANDPFMEYQSDWHGGWSYTHGLSGYNAQQWADNSTFVMGSGNLAVPQMFRHVVASGQTRQRVVFNQSDRNPNPQPPFGWAYGQAVSGGLGGLGITCDVSGNFTLNTGTSGRTFTVAISGFGTVVISSSGISISASGSLPINLTATTTTINGDLNVTGEVRGKSGGTNIHLTTHDHSGVQPGSGNTGPPVAGS